MSDERSSADDAIDVILDTPGLLAETRDRLPVLEQALSPCGDAFVGAKLGEWSLVYDPGVRAETPAFWAPYKRALHDLPADALMGAMEEWERQPDAEFFPKPGPLRALALKRAAPLYTAIGRARRAVKEKRRPAPSVRPSAEEARAFVESLGLKRKAL